MSACNFNQLLRFANKQLDVDGQLEIYGHLDRCDICRDAIYQLSRDRDDAFFAHRTYRPKPSVRRRSKNVAIGFSGA